MGESKLIRHQACDNCASSDACAVFDDGHKYCFSCSTYFPGDIAVIISVPNEDRLPRPKPALKEYSCISIPERKLTEESCKKWSYGTDSAGNHVANYLEPGSSETVAQKLRTKDKKFTILGDAKKMSLYGQWLWQKGGKYLTITEGEIDALSVSQVNNHKWPVVSVPNGAQAAPKAIRENLEWVESFDTVVFMFDTDEPGIQAAKACAAILKPGKAKIARLPCKDPNECLQKGLGSAIIESFWHAEEFRPDGILGADAVLNRLRSTKSLQPVAGFFVKKLDIMTKGMRAGELVTVCAGTGIGKSEFVRELAFNCRERGLKIGYVALEESVERSALSLVGLKLNRPIKFDERPLETPGFEEAWEGTIKDYFYFFDHFGSLEEGNLLSRLRYLRVGCQVDVIILDHISIVVSGMETGDERRSFDTLMTKLRSLSEETGVVVVLISHLKRPATGTPLEEGGQTSLSLLRGSASIAQLSDTVIGLERDQQNELTKDVTTVRLLKCRWTGFTGFAGCVVYNHETGRLIEIDKEQEKLLTGFKQEVVL